MTLACVLCQSILDQMTLNVACQLAVHIFSQLLKAKSVCLAGNIYFPVAFNYPEALTPPD